MAVAMTAAAGASGTRAVMAGWIKAKFGERALARMTAVLLGATLVASALLVSGST
jgi:hypothetical protein